MTPDELAAELVTITRMDLPRRDGGPCWVVRVGESSIIVRLATEQQAIVHAEEIREPIAEAIRQAIEEDRRARS
jgi:hypothetical protein